MFHNENNVQNPTPRVNNITSEEIIEGERMAALRELENEKRREEHVRKGDEGLALPDTKTEHGKTKIQKIIGNFNAEKALSSLKNIECRSKK